MYEVQRFCSDCKTTRTPLWRSGPDGPRSLCNACGIRYRKRKMTEDGDKINPADIRRERASHSTEHGDEMNETMKMRIRDLGKEMIVQRPSSSSTTTFSSSLIKRQRSKVNRRKIGEVEQAAVLLMSLSCGSVFA